VVSDRFETLSIVAVENFATDPVETTPATTPDDNMLAVVHASLKDRDLLPAEHLVDKGYTDSHGEFPVDSARWVTTFRQATGWEAVKAYRC
jgi:hypothetical protein